MLPFNLSKNLKYKTVKKIGKTCYLISTEYVGDVPIVDRLMEVMTKDYEQLLESPENIQKFHSGATDENTGFFYRKVI
jgi:hypothetical protein